MFAITAQMYDVFWRIFVANTGRSDQVIDSVHAFRSFLDAHLTVAVAAPATWA